MVAEAFYNALTRQIDFKPYSRPLPISRVLIPVHAPTVINSVADYVDANFRTVTSVPTNVANLSTPCAISSTTCTLTGNTFTTPVANIYTAPSYVPTDAQGTLTTPPANDTTNSSDTSLGMQSAASTTTISAPVATVNTTSFGVTEEPSNSANSTYGMPANGDRPRTPMAGNITNQINAHVAPMKGAVQKAAKVVHKPSTKAKGSDDAENGGLVLPAGARRTIKRPRAPDGSLRETEASQKKRKRIM